MQRAWWLVMASVVFVGCTTLGSQDPCTQLEDAVTALQQPTTCVKTICLTGALDQSSASNNGFTALCDDARIPGLVRDCSSGTCLSTFDNVGPSVGGDIYPVLFSALDVNADGELDDLDPPCAVNILGFSWGGINAVDLAELFLTDANVSTSRRRVDLLVLLDAYQPFMGSSVDIPSGVARTLSFRHSVAPAGDCSTSAPLGPYLGIPPACAGSTTCQDHDYSRAPDTTFCVASGGTYDGTDVGHCEVPVAAHLNVLLALHGEPLQNLP